MEITFEALREAGVRLPKQVGSAVSIVGALVIGEASYKRVGFSANGIVVAITGMASFMMPRYCWNYLSDVSFPIMLLAVP